MNFPKWLLYITNNEEVSRHEIHFDVWFFLINTAAVVLGSIFLVLNGEYPWVSFLVIEYVWALDTIRHNRE